MEFSEDFDVICRGMVEQYKDMQNIEPKDSWIYGDRLSYSRHYQELDILQASISESD